MAEESRLRTKAYIEYGCNAYSRKNGFKSTPLGFWTQNDILEYIYMNNLEIASVYGEVVEDGVKTINDIEIKQYKTTGENRTGCIFCMYGCHLEPKDDNRFIRLSETHPQLYDYCMRGGKHDEDGRWTPDKGLGMAHVLDELGVKYENE